MRLYKRGKYWWVQVANKRISTHSERRGDAERIAREIERRFIDPSLATETETSLSRAIESLLLDRQGRGRSEQTIKQYAHEAGHFLRIWGDCPLSSVTAARVDAFIQTRLTERVTRHTIAKELGVLRALLRVARRRGEYTRDPAAVLPLAWDSGYKPRTRYLTPAEVKKLLDALPPNRAAWVAFAIATSANYGETERALPADVDLKRGIVKIRGSKTRYREREVPVMPFTRDLLVFALANGDGIDTLFLPWQNANRDIKRACVKIGSLPCSTNDLRRTTATWLRQAGTAPNLIGAVLGHADSKMVERVYGRLDGDGLKKALGSVPILYRHRGIRGG